MWDHPSTMMLARATYAGVRTSLAGLLGLRAAVWAGGLTELLRLLGDLVFAGNDREARWRGWSIERRHAGLSRVYRDPMFDRLVRCRDCRGAGSAGGPPCASCSGSGRLILDQPPIPRRPASPPGPEPGRMTWPV